MLPETGILLSLRFHETVNALANAYSIYWDFAEFKLIRFLTERKFMFSIISIAWLQTVMCLLDAYNAHG